MAIKIRQRLWSGNYEGEFDRRTMTETVVNGRSCVEDGQRLDTPSNFR